MQLSEIMTRNVFAVAADATLQEAAEAMTSHDVGFLPVVENNLPVGVVTDRDIVTRGVARGADPRQTPVGQVMTPDLETMSEDATVEEAAQLMQQKQIRRLMVLNADRRIVGVVALGDLAVEGADSQISGQALAGVSQPTH